MFAATVAPGSFRRELHCYEKTRAAIVHPLVARFFRLPPEEFAALYRRRYPQARAGALARLLRRSTRHLAWAGCDLVPTLDREGRRRMALLETNSCPAGNKSMPLLDANEPLGGYGALLARAFLPRLGGASRRDGSLAVLHGKNLMEAGGYAAALAELSGEEVLQSTFDLDDPDPPARFAGGALELRDEAGAWRRVRAAIRFVNAKPWTRIPVAARSRLFNPVIACLAGGRSKGVALRAYRDFNARHADLGLALRYPETAAGAALGDLPELLRRWGGRAVVKEPYSNAGKGVHFLGSPADLAAFLRRRFEYRSFVAQRMIGDPRWAGARRGRFDHAGLTLPGRPGRFAFDLRVMAGSGPGGFFPLSLYGRRARSPLAGSPPCGEEAWAMLSTNITVQLPGGGVRKDTERVLLASTAEFDALGLELEDLADAFVQTVFAMLAIDALAGSLLGPGGRLRARRLRALDGDPALAAELAACPG